MLSTARHAAVVAFLLAAVNAAPYSKFKLFERKEQAVSAPLEVKIDSILGNIYETYVTAAAFPDGEDVALGSLSLSSEFLQTKGDKLIISLVAYLQDTKDMVAEAQAFGFELAACDGYMCSGYFPVENLPLINDMVNVNFAAASLSTTNAGPGSVVSKAVESLFVNEIKAKYGVTGAGMTIGVLSNSYNCLGGASADIASDNLPSVGMIQILNDTSCARGTDEGRAMMQLIHDIAPDAKLAFHTASFGETGFAQGIKRLAAEAKCNIIVDDVRYFTEPFFQDGIVARAVNEVAAAGVPYFSAAGNYYRNSWESASGFVPGGPSGINATLMAHDFDLSNGVATRQKVRIAAGSNITFILQWDDPFFSVSGPPGAATDVDFVLYYNNAFLNASTFNNTGHDPVEIITIDALDKVNDYDIELEIVLFSGPAPKFLKWISLSEIKTVQFATNSGTLFGHAHATGGAGVGAAQVENTPQLGVTPAIHEDFTSPGGVPVFFDETGKRLAQPDIRKQPRFVGPDGLATTFRTRFNPFFGTSAAAPCVAALAALLLQVSKNTLSPSQLYTILQNTAVDMNDKFTVNFDTGFDNATGFGYVNGLAAANAAAAAGPPGSPTAPPMAAPRPPTAPPVVVPRPPTAPPVVVPRPPTAPPVVVPRPPTAPPVVVPRPPTAPPVVVPRLPTPRPVVVPRPPIAPITVISPRIPAPVKPPTNTMKKKTDDKKGKKGMKTMKGMMRRMKNNMKGMKGGGNNMNASTSNGGMTGRDLRAPTNTMKKKTDDKKGEKGMKTMNAMMGRMKNYMKGMKSDGGGNNMNASTSKGGMTARGLRAEEKH